MYTGDEGYGYDFDVEDLYTRVDPMRTIMKQLAPCSVGGTSSEMPSEKTYCYKGNQYTIKGLSDLTKVPVEKIRQALAGHYYAKEVDYYIDSLIKSYNTCRYFIWRGNYWKLSDLSRVTGISIKDLEQMVDRYPGTRDITDIVRVDFNELAKNNNVLKQRYMYRNSWYTLADLSARFSIAPAEFLKHVCDNRPSKSINRWIDDVTYKIPKEDKDKFYTYDGEKTTITSLVEKTGVDETTVSRWLEDMISGADITRYVNNCLYNYDTKHTYLWREQRLNIREIAAWSNSALPFVRSALREKDVFADVTSVITSRWYMFREDYEALDNVCFYEGEYLTVRELSSKLQLPADNITSVVRLASKIKSVTKSLNDFINTHSAEVGYYQYNGKLMHVDDIAKEVGVTEKTAAIWLSKYMPGCVVDASIDLGVRELLRYKYYRYEGMLLGKLQIANKTGLPLEAIEEKLKPITPGTDITDLF